MMKLRLSALPCLVAILMYILITLSLSDFAGAIAYQNARFGEGSGPIFLDDVHCGGLESRLIECPANRIGDHNCGHFEDAGVQCFFPG